jgi:RNA polymerase sigma-70 factor (ECF subfamily)
MDKTSTESTGRQHISQIETIWPVVMQAHVGAPSEINAAQQVILQQYRLAVYRYLLACLGNSDSADEVWQEFSLRFVRGDFRNANPEKGRFRDLLKSALYHLIIDFHKRKQRDMPHLSPDGPEPSAQMESTYDSDRQFLKAWREEVLNRTWDLLADEERRSGRSLHTVLRFRADHPDMRSAQMAEELSPRLGKTVTADWIRKWLHEGREKFAELLLEEVARSLRDPSPDAVEEELIDLSLYEYCKPALLAWRERLRATGA